MDDHRSSTAITTHRDDTKSYGAITASKRYDATTTTTRPTKATLLPLSSAAPIMKSLSSSRKDQSTSQIHYSSWNDDDSASRRLPAKKRSYVPPSMLANSPPKQIKHKHTERRFRAEEETAEDYSLETDHDDENDDNNNNNNLDKNDQNISEDELGTAHHKQNYAPLSTTFVILQIIILPLMMWQCGIAPLEINPMIGPYPDALNYWGAKNAVLIVDDGQVYRLVTPIFLHAGIIHLAGNVLVQMDSGNRWEKEWGSLIWILVYVGSAIGSSVLSVIAMPDQISVGSSGAIMGLFGAKFAEIVVLLCEKVTTVREMAASQSRKEQACHVILGIIVVMAMSFIPYVDWAAHLGGLVAGFAIGIVLFSFKMRNKFGTVFWLGVGIATCFLLYSTFIAIMFTTETDDEMRDICAYYQKNLEGYECKCQLNEEWAANHNYAWVSNYENGEGGGEEGGGGADGGGK